MDKRNVPFFADLRSNALAVDADKSGIPTIGSNAIYGVIMDIGFPEGWATIVAFADGNASLYLSGGGGVIGGIGHDSVKATAVKLVTLANQYISLSTPTTATPLPTTGEVTFNILTAKGIRTVTANETDLGEERHKLSPLFYAGQDVITQLRLVSDMK